MSNKQRIIEIMPGIKLEIDTELHPEFSSKGLEINQDTGSRHLEFSLTNSGIWEKGIYFTISVDTPASVKLWKEQLERMRANAFNRLA